MRKRVISLVCLACLLCVLLLPLQIHGVTAVDVDRSCSLTLQYAKDEYTFSGLNIAIYRAAEIFADGTYSLCGDFAQYPVNIYGITSQTEWKQITSTLVAYAAADQLIPYEVGVTDETGTVRFTSLPTGMYLVLSARAENSDGTFCFDAFMISVPNADDSGTFSYDVTAYPKCGIYEPNPKDLEYKVVKQWKDSGFSEKRPDSITVDIYKDGKLDSTQVLSDENNWSYSWRAPDDGSNWQAVEREVPEGYNVTITSDSGTIVITNAYKEQTQKPPKTGDTALLWPYILGMCISGSLLLLLGVRRMRKMK